jgi:predicted DNA binding protein/GAF domain-containing protein
VTSRSDDRTALSTAGYRRLRRATETHREELVLRLAGEVGLTPAEVTRVTPGDVTFHERDGVDHHFLAVPGPEGGVERNAYLPPDVEHDLRQYARTADLTADDRLVDVSARRVQMLVSDVADRAADRTDAPQLRDVSTQTLRAFFARRLLAEEGVDPRVVAAVGGWSRLASLDPYVDPGAVDRDAVAAAFTVTDRAPEPAADTAGPSADARFDVAFDAVQAVTDVLADAATRENVETAVCAALADGGAYEAAWVARPTAESVAVAASGGPAPDLDGSDPEAVTELLATEEPLVVDDARAAPEFAALREHADTAGYRAAAVVPLSDGDTQWGVLGVGASIDGWGERERALLLDLGRHVGQAIALAEQRRLLLADTVVEVAFEAGESSLFARAAAEHGCSFAFEGVVPGEDRSLVFFVTLDGAPPEAVLSWAGEREAVVDSRLVRDHGDDALLEVVLSGGDLATELAAHGATVRDLSASASGERVVAEISPEADVRALADDLAVDFPDLELASKRERERSGQPATAFRASLHESLTDKQAAVLRAAFHAGYFEWPRGSTAEELADAIGVTSPTLHNHLRRAQQKLLSEFVDDDAAGRAADSPWPDDGD